MSLRTTIFGINPDLFCSITDLSGNEYGKGVELFFTVPCSVYEISHYRAYVDGIFHENITDIDCVIGLVPGVTYQIYIEPVDVNGNVGKKSNTITVTTPAWQTFLFDNFPRVDSIYSPKRMIASAVYAFRLQRDTDLAETDLELPSSGFISLNSMTSSGQTLGDWVGSGTAEILIIYDQKGVNHLILNTIISVEVPPKGTLVESGVLKIENGLPCFELYQKTGSSANDIGFSFYKEGFNGSTTPNTFFTDGFQINLYKMESTTLSAFSLGGFGEAIKNESITRQKWNPAQDNSIRFFGGALLGDLPIVTFNLRTDFKTGYFYDSYINGNVNHKRDYLNNTNTSKYFYGLQYGEDETPYTRKYHLNACSSNGDLRKIRRLIEQQTNIEFNNYVTL